MIFKFKRNRSKLHLQNGPAPKYTIYIKLGYDIKTSVVNLRFFIAYFLLLALNSNL